MARDELPTIDDEALRRLEALARLELGDAERERLEADLTAVLGFVATLRELPDEVGRAPFEVPQRTRPDEPRPGLAREAALSVAPATRDGYFEVPRTVDEG